MPSSDAAPRTVIIGGTAGIGLATARRLAAEGHAVTVVGRTPQRIDEAVASITASVTASNGGGVQGRRADLTDRASLDALFAELGEFENLVVTAPGNGTPGNLLDLDLAALHSAFDSKFIAYAHTVQAAAPYLDKQTGSITLVSAASAQTALPGTAGLAAVNGAVETMVPTLALELAPIRVNAVSPGVVDTGWWDRVVPADQRPGLMAEFAKGIPAGRVGRPDEIADAIALLVRNGFLTGTVLPIDGGARLKPQPS
jgi:NAD(P)-dependent dehydrogenase (short-subunit alcohol dehydrogenase family)